MKRLCMLLSGIVLCGCAAMAAEKPWKHGQLKVSDNSLYLSHTDGTPFFWLGDTGWLLPQRLDRDEAAYYLKRCGEAGYNVVQIQVINGIPAFNTYGQMSMPDGFDFSNIDKPGVYGYWDHMDYIIDMAERNGIYIGMVCIWGGMVKAGMMNEEQAVAYGTFLANRYKDKPNIVWIMGGDVQGDIHPEVWDTLARTIRSIDKNHAMTYHPRGRHTSAQWFADREWLDFHMFQSGHRRYNQRMGNKNYPIQEGTEEDSWMYVDSTRVHAPLRPVLDGEPSYEDIPQGLHGADEPRWSAKDVRRYAYWSVFAGSCGHTYGHNSIMQFVRPGVNGAYFADGIEKPWYKALDDDGFNQMVHLKRLMLAFPYFERVADQSVIRDNGVRYDRLIATRGNDYVMVYNHTGRPMDIDLRKISGREHNAWWMDAATGTVKYIGKAGKDIRYTPESDADGVLIVADVKSGYLTPETTSLVSLPKPEKRDLTE
ncbi:glycoside hydrolase family 140 protein [Muribaculum intestinale]|uniref:glycoside hydrolase family 140 protein n=1 Tax=Muribaculum intestinale TaxID=1796646 RepID=UPI003F7398AA